MWTRIRRIWTAPVFEQEAKTQAAQLLHTMLLLILVAGAMMFVVALLLTGVPTGLEIESPVFAALLVIVAVSGFLVLTHYGRILLTSVLLLLMLWALATFWIVSRFGVSNSNTVLTLAWLIVLAGLLLGRRGAVALTLLNGLTVLVGYALQSAGYLPPPPAVATPMDLFLLVMQLILIGLLLHYAMSSMTDTMRQAQRHAQAQNEANRELEALRASLEQRVAARTRDLERRTAQLQVAAEVGQVATSTLDAGQLAGEVTDLLYHRFGFYHVGLFETDPSGQWAEYRAGAGPEAQTLLQRGFRLETSGESLVGRCITNAQSQVNQDIGAGEVYHLPPFASIARSEAALPLIARGQVIGALDVLSEQPHAFDREMIASLQTIADQVAVALDNARLFGQSRQALESARRAYSELTQQTWSDLLHGRRDWGYRYTYRAIEPLGGDWPPEVLQALETGQSVQQVVAGENVLSIPLQVRDQTVGVLSFYKPQGDDVAWTADEINLLEQIIQQMGVALESAQFYEESQQRALQERIAREITARMRETLDVDTVLRTSVQEIRQALGLASMTIRLVEPAQRA